jgi:restriction system protein
MVSRDPSYRAWRNFEYSLTSFERALNEVKYKGPFAPATPSPSGLLRHFDLPKGALPAGQANVLSSLSIEDLPGVTALSVIPPKFPSLPTPPALTLSLPSDVAEMAKDLTKRFESLKSRLAAKRAGIEAEIMIDRVRTEGLRERFSQGDQEAIRSVLSLVLQRHALPPPLVHTPHLDCDFDDRIILCTIEVPDFAKLSIVAKRAGSYRAKWLPIAASAKRKASETILLSMSIRTAYLIARSDDLGAFDTIAVNVRQHWSDPATGAPREGIIASLQASASEVRSLVPAEVDPKACFRHLAGICTPSVERVTAVRPIFVLNKDDRRIVKERDVDATLTMHTNLAAMPWDDFEHLVRQLFEWEFGRTGVEVKVTRASRDRGVDAIMFDPDPLRGGKYVLQAKRYTRTVDVAAVRDLYGTVVNEGANRGILPASPRRAARRQGRRKRREAQSFCAW